MGCQGVEWVGHILKVLAHLSGYNPELFGGNLAEMHEFRFAVHHEIVEVLSSADECQADIGEEVEEPARAKGTRKGGRS